MKLNKIIYIIPLVAIIVATGCRKSQFNINQNINNPTDSTVAYDVVLPAAMHASGAIYATSWGPIQNWMGYWARSGTYAPNVAEETYEITTGFGNGIWNNIYDNNYDYQIVQTKAATAGAGFYEGIARIMKAHNFQVLVDVYGNVPYTEALKGSGNPTPAYDKGLDIYKDLLRQIDMGMELIRDASVQTTGPNKEIAKNDIMFGTSQYPQGALSLGAYTDQQKLRWLKFGNTLKLRLLIHAYAVAAIDKNAEMAIINGFQFNGSTVGFMGVNDDAQIQPGYAAPDKPMPFYSVYKFTTTGAQTANNVYYRANKWGINYYQWDGDPRRSENRLYEPGSGGLVGVDYGLPPINANAASVLAGIGPGLYRTNTSPQIFFSAAESFFLQAEARVRGWITSGPSAAVLLSNGIVESMRFLGVANPATAAANYIAGNGGYPDVDITAPALHTTPGGSTPAGGIFTILSQKWFALNGISTLEVWTDYRRVPYSEVAGIVYNGSAANSAPAPTDRFVYGDGGDYIAGPAISVAPSNTSTKIPVRYLYPQTEYNYNTANVAAEGTVDRYTKIFWDLN